MTTRAQVGDDTRMRAFLPVSFASIVLCLAGCPGDSSAPDAFMSSVDAAAPTTDAYSADDAIAPGVDAFSADDAFSANDAFASSDAFVSGDACVLPTGVDLDGLGADCGDATCAEGLECVEDSGFALGHICAIPCAAADGGDCACPEGTTCGVRTDKAGNHAECQRNDV